MKKSFFDKHKFRNAIIVILAIWFLLAFLRTILNLGKVIENGRLFLVSENQKRNELFRCYPIVSFLKNKVGRNSNIALYTQDGACFFELQYYLYPAHIYWNQVRPISKNSKYSYVVLFVNTKKNIVGKNLVKTILIGNEKALIYK